MKKPLILLVDDDPAVLEALEAELTPVFAEICRIAVFDNPAQVLDELPAWKEEKRAIAVAIMDHKMPGMSGLQLLEALRTSVHREGAEGDFAPTSHMKAVLLTGYADLENAVAAKNRGKVERYLEKPWAGSELVPLVRELIGDQCHRMPGGGYYEFREVKDEVELFDYLKLRYDIYRSTEGMGHLLPDSELAIDLDSYDSRSRFFGLFKCGGGGRDRGHPQGHGA